MHAGYGSRLGHHPDRTLVPGVEISSTAHEGRPLAVVAHVEVKGSY